MSQERGQKLARQDFISNQDVRWCPGCGDYSILAQTQKSLPDLGIPRENFVFISGIGCSSRFPYYMNTYGFHTIHGRAPTLASGVKLARPDLSVWVVTGDGDSLSIGGNHFIHVLRRNIDLNIVLFNNRIYGLTKGQYSPTSELGKVTKSTPFGSLDTPFNPPAVALGAQATFVARSIDRYPSHLQKMLGRAHGHKGASFLEVYQNCLIFNDGAFRLLTEKETKGDHVLELENGKPMIFGKEKNKGIRLNGFKPEVVTLDGDYSTDDLLIHNETDKNIADVLTNFTYDSEFPTPIGVLFVAKMSTYEDRLDEQIKTAKEQLGEGNLEALIRGADTWEVE
ncbi:MAG: 2-oxoacid:ferredoxin oxidoreductase subunit beta [Candidatus Marinimicrobia bacterium]|jgi:2-oxoglutarate ferredoxin oxidoreductase subunit beta|nr:2-oxoacid:ferredoxin oxidoreductase subunit beta [Candidatus Neomarinimicrobiota bacterium]MDP7026069.1 2-oxoacid:ferredoxin oxidoreductase subunit beta [Candidatus Neomarinimicrobiota bacterium]|tara:strand:- start:8813 stop:9829 length:1017 start_codon:yes stop_codon:yes gene_type:complete